MKLFSHFAVVGFSNTFLLGPDEGGDAILVDPGVMDMELLELIESNNYYVKYILVTTPHEAHVQGLKTILKIYDARIYSGTDRIFDKKSYMVSDGETLELGNFSVRFFFVSGHSPASIVIKIGDLLFSGDAIGAGRLGDSPNSYAREILKNAILDRFQLVDNDLLIFPAHGPPTTLEAERRFNPAFIENPENGRAEGR